MHKYFSRKAKSINSSKEIKNEFDLREVHASPDQEQSKWANNKIWRGEKRQSEWTDGPIRTPWS